MEDRLTKAQKFEMIEDILTGIETEDAKMLVEFVQAEKAALARKAAKAKEKAAEKKAEIDELGEVVLSVLNAEPKTRDEVFALVEFDGVEISVAKIGARLTRLVELGKIQKSEVKAITASGKKTTRMAYSLVSE